LEAAAIEKLSRPRRNGAPGPSAPAPSASTGRPPAHVASTDERAAAGKALRDRIPRTLHAGWKSRADRPDPIALLQASDAERLPELIPIRYGRMLQSAFAFYRGAAAVMASDLAGTPDSGLRVQACGDCHLMNFGGFATPERNILFDINDFDETLPAPWEWDVKRLAVSFVLAARSQGLSDDLGRRAAADCVRSYRKHLRQYAQMAPLELWHVRVTGEDFIAAMPQDRRAALRARMDKALDRPGSEVDFPKLTDMVGGRLGIRDAPPLIFHPQEAHAPDFQAVVGQILASYRRTLSPDHRTLLDQYHFVDAAIKVVGVGSVGRRCWIVLLMSAANEPLFLQLKEAVASVLEPFAGKSAYDHHGQRVVMGQRLMQPASDMFLGWVTEEANGRQFYVRQLRDAKIKPLVETYDADMLLFYAKACGWVLARAHAKSGDACAIGGYLGSSDQFDVAIGDFALAYADQNDRDFAALKAAVRSGKVTACNET
jgi:uncharacterized protein (DUF2252 family)